MSGIVNEVGMSSVNTHYSSFILSNYVYLHYDNFFKYVHLH